MAKQHRNYPDRKDVTNPFWWCAAIICTIITIGVIIVGIIVFVGYLVIHPRVPNISVVDARLNQFQYDYTGVLITQVTIVLRSQNDNSKAHVSFSGLKLNLIFDGTVIAILQAGEYNVSKHNHVDFNFVATSSPISLDPQQMQTVDASLNQDRVRFDLKGDAKVRWRVGLLGSVRSPFTWNACSSFAGPMEAIFLRLVPRKPNDLYIFYPFVTKFLNLAYRKKGGKNSYTG